MRTTNYTLQRATNICHSLNTEQIKVKISRKSTLCSVQIICTVNQVSGTCASCKVPFIKNANFHIRTGHEIPEGEKMYSSTLSLTSVIDGGAWAEPRPGRFTSGKDTVPLIKNARMESKPRQPKHHHMVMFRQKVLPSYYFIVTGCKLGDPSSTSDNQQHGCTKLLIRRTANCTVAPKIFIILIADPFLTSHVCIVSHAPC